VFEGSGTGLGGPVSGTPPRQVLEELARNGVTEYSLLRASLEDLYLELTGQELEEADVALPG
jgi:hypothetical protein